MKASTVSAEAPNFFQRPNIPIKELSNINRGVKANNKSNQSHLNSQMTVQFPYDSDKYLKDPYINPRKDKVNFGTLGYANKTQYDDFSNLLPSQVQDFMQRNSSKILQSNYFNNFNQAYRQKNLSKPTGIFYQYVNSMPATKRDYFSLIEKAKYRQNLITNKYRNQLDLNQQLSQTSQLKTFESIQVTQAQSSEKQNSSLNISQLTPLESPKQLKQKDLHH